MRDQVFTILQAIGRSFMLPVAILPIAGLLLGIGASFTNATTIQTYGLENILGNGTILHSLLTIMSDAGNIIFGNLPIIFAVGVAIGMAKQEKEVAALSAMIAFLVMHASTSSVLKLTGKVLADNTVSPDVLEGTIANINGIMSLQEGVFGGIIVGIGVQVVYGPQVAVIKSNLENYLATNPQDGPIEAVPEAAPAEEPKKEAAAPAKTDAEKRYFNSPFTGALHPITEAPDEAFASKMTGDGFFVYPKDGVVYAPEDSTVTFVFETKHAIGMTTADGVEYLLHIGIDTVNLNGQGFKVFVENGQEVKKGDKLMEFDDEYIKANAPSDACLCIFTDTDQVSDVSLVKTGNVKAGEQAVYF